MPFSKLPYARICIILVRHSGPSLTNESAEAITRPPKARCGATQTLENASDCVLQGRMYTAKESVSGVLGDIKDRVEVDRRSSTSKKVMYLQANQPSSSSRLVGAGSGAPGFDSEIGSLT